jgi:hypothetical protein
VERKHYENRALAQIVLFLTEVQNFEAFLIHALKGVASQKQILRNVSYLK